ncbi:hypothetical protein PV328_007210 [Microctonus aethiopoides]|uniref:Uncharacterized protein n=1 Tax=Microctonus aethiopoides TaxID=144406 RepID=A0AA39FQR7_9HYME|nr:hypothetical protein PV328_007210 [Microctonus aethiopoides]
MRSGPKLPQERNSPQMPLIDFSIDSPSVSFLGNVEGGQPGLGISNYQLQSIFSNPRPLPVNPVPVDDEKYSVEDVAIGENPLAFGMKVEPQSPDLSLINDDATPIPATVIMCGGSVYFIPVNSERMPVCEKSASPYDNSMPPKILFQPRNHWGNYSNFFAQYGNQNIFNTMKNNDSFIRNEGTTAPIPAVEDIIFTQPTASPTTSPPVIMPITPEETIQSSELPISIQQPEILEYEEQSSCLEDESWDNADHQCVPVKYHKDAEYDYSDVKKRDGDNPKIIIMTPEAGMYIESD